MPDDAEDMGPKGGKRNAIATYEELAAIASGVRVLDTKMDAVNALLAERRKGHDDHEVRLRALELTQAQFIAASTSRQGTVAGLWGVLLSVLAIAFTALSYFQP